MVISTPIVIIVFDGSAVEKREFRVRQDNDPVCPLAFYNMKDMHRLATRFENMPPASSPCYISSPSDAGSIEPTL